MIYAIGTHWGRADKDFRYYFHIGIGNFYDGWSTFIFKKICINIFKFDDYLHSMYGDYEERGLCMEELIIEKYGIEANKLIHELI
ncbi:MAG: hypothetical protein LBK94_05060, partial [Prevotellaceae bacterium]|jgi:hypothetical protein|nr:hypothetical protein [Prevotellaceae bacterium]